MFQTISYAITGWTGTPTPLAQCAAALAGFVQLNPRMRSVAFAQCSPLTMSPSRPMVWTSSSAGAVMSAMTPMGCLAQAA